MCYDVFLKEGAGRRQVFVDNFLKRLLVTHVLLFECQIRKVQFHQQKSAVSLTLYICSVHFSNIVLVFVYQLLILISSTSHIDTNDFNSHFVVQIQMLLKPFKPNFPSQKMLFNQQFHLPFSANYHKLLSITSPPQRDFYAY